MAARRRSMQAEGTTGGGHACGNGLRAARRVAESKFLAGMKAELSALEYLEKFKRVVRQARADT